jgi:hypothetical protein
MRAVQKHPGYIMYLKGDSETRRSDGPTSSWNKMAKVDLRLSNAAVSNSSMRNSTLRMR